MNPNNETTTEAAPAALPVKPTKLAKPVKQAKTTPAKAAKAAEPTKAAKVAKPAKPVEATPAAPAPVAKRVAAKSAAKTAAKPVATAAPAEADKATRAKEHPKEKLVRDSFTMPRADFALIAQLKERALGFQRPTKKSELLRAGLQALSALGDDALRALLAQLPTLKTGRPRKAD